MSASENHVVVMTIRPLYVGFIVFHACTHATVLGIIAPRWGAAGRVACCASLLLAWSVSSASDYATCCALRDLVREPAASKALSSGDKALAAGDAAEALQRYKDIAASKDRVLASSAFERLGEAYAEGTGVKQDFTRSVQEFQTAALLGDPYAEANLADFLFFGVGTPADPKQALNWALKAGTAGIAPAMSRLGWQYLNGLGTTADAEQARQWYRKGADKGDLTSQYQLAWIYEHVDPNDYQKAMRWYKEAATTHDTKGAQRPEEAKAQNNIGYMLEQGLGVAVDYESAARWYAIAARSGYVRALYHLGNLYAEGLGVSRDLPLARTLMQRAAEKGDGDATEWLATH
jgi:TPR repeat protein